MKSHVKHYGLAGAGLILIPCILAAFYIGALYMAHDFNPDFMKIDSCLDSGGRWNYETRSCDHEEGEP